jgi:hypothetical protein
VHLRALSVAFALVSIVVLAPAGGARTAAPFKVTSTLDGKAVLPHRIRWLGFPSLVPAKVAKVEFVIDGKMHWTEHTAPYVYAGDDSGRNEGYLVTSWLSPGDHHFAVRVTATDGTVETDTVTARVLPAPAPPAALAGKWERTIDVSGAPKPGSAGNPTDTVTPSGRYTMTFDKQWIRDQFPGKWVYPQSNNTGDGLYNFDDYAASATRIHVVGEVIFHPVSEKLPEGGSWCYPSGPPADYDWSISGNTLTLAPVGGRDACGIRGFIWTGTWTRVG